MWQTYTEMVDMQNFNIDAVISSSPVALDLRGLIMSFTKSVSAGLKLKERSDLCLF